MAAKRGQNCWEIMQCDDEDMCPVRVNSIKRCWELMEKNNEFQFRYGLCYECIVYLCNNENANFSENEINQLLGNCDLCEHGF